MTIFQMDLTEHTMCVFQNAHQTIEMLMHICDVLMDFLIHGYRHYSSDVEKLTRYRARVLWYLSNLAYAIPKVGTVYTANNFLFTVGGTNLRSLKPTVDIFLLTKGSLERKTPLILIELLLYLIYSGTDCIKDTYLKGCPSTLGFANKFKTEFKITYYDMIQILSNCCRHEIDMISIKFVKTRFVLRNGENNEVKFTEVSNASQQLQPHGV